MLKHFRGCQDLALDYVQVIFVSKDCFWSLGIEILTEFKIEKAGQ